MTPADCDLRGLPFMPLDTIRLLDSDLFALSTGDEFKAALALWCKAWLQIPGGSLPNDERVLAYLSGARGVSASTVDARDATPSAPASWSDVRDVAMRGWQLCSDGRYYHPVVAEKAIEAWEKRGKWRERESSKSDRQQRWREKLRILSSRLREAGVIVPEHPKAKDLEALCRQHGVDPNVEGETSTVVAKTTAKTGDRGQGKGIFSVAKATDAPSASADSGMLDVTQAADAHLWETGKRFLQSRGVAKAQSGSVIGKWKGKHGTAAVIEALGVAQREPDLVDPIPFIERVLRRRSGADNETNTAIGGIRLSSPC